MGSGFPFLGKNGVRIQSLWYTKKQTASLFLEVSFRVIFFHVSKNMQERLRRSLRGGFNPIERYRICGHFRIAECAGFLVSLTKPPLSAQLKAKDCYNLHRSRQNGHSPPHFRVDTTITPNTTHLAPQLQDLGEKMHLTVADFKWNRLIHIYIYIIYIYIQ